MARWFRFFAERFPLPALLMVSGGVTAVALCGQRAGMVQIAAAWLPTLLFFAVLRLMDEVKDYERDVVAHPERPLPRGLLSLAEARVGVRVGLGLLFFCAATLAAVGYARSGALFLLTTIHLYGMYREFGIGGWLEKRPLLYALSHQAVLLPLCAGIAAVVGAEASWLRVGAFVLGAFFTYEVARKLDPDAHPVLRTYRKLYGEARTGFLIVAASLLTMSGGWFAFGLQGWIWLLWGSEIALCILYFSTLRRHFRWTEHAAGLSLLLHLWLPAAISLLR